MKKALYPDFLEYSRLYYSLAHSEFVLNDIVLKDGDTMEVCIYDYKADSFEWIPVVFHCSHDYDESYYRQIKNTHNQHANNILSYLQRNNLLDL